MRAADAPPIGMDAADGMLASIEAVRRARHAQHGGWRLVGDTDRVNQAIHEQTRHCAAAEQHAADADMQLALIKQRLEIADREAAHSAEQYRQCQDQLQRTWTQTGRRPSSCRPAALGADRSERCAPLTPGGAAETRRLQAELESTRAALRAKEAVRRADRSRISDR